MICESKICSECGSLLVEYKFGLNRGLVGFMRELARIGRACHLDELNLTKGQYTNHALIVHWGLAEMMAPANELEERKGGKWRLTKAGVDFLRGHLRVARFIYTKQGIRTRVEGPPILVSDISDGYLYHGDYAEYASDQLRGDLSDQLEIPMMTKDDKTQKSEDVE